MTQPTIDQERELSKVVGINQLSRRCMFEFDCDEPSDVSIGEVAFGVRHELEIRKQSRQFTGRERERRILHVTVGPVHMRRRESFIDQHALGAQRVPYEHGQLDPVKESKYEDEI